MIELGFHTISLTLKGVEGCMKINPSKTHISREHREKTQELRKRFLGQKYL
jgi:hypothetical protein